MCGIVGVAGREAADYVSRSIQRLRHRGPDGEGLFTDPAFAVTLGHTRLAIQDPRPEGNQSFTDTASQAVLVFNGEIHTFDP